MPRILSHSVIDERKPHERLSQMQFLVAKRLVNGKKKNHIAKELGIHRTTVLRYQHRILAAMQLPTDKALIFYAKRTGAFS